ncbi:hypothetical protein HDU76_009481, partial [Blyttiomyces sp. JEL0837]
MASTTLHHQRQPQRDSSTSSTTSSSTLVNDDTTTTTTPPTFLNNIKNHTTTTTTSAFSNLLSLSSSLRSRIRGTAPADNNEPTSVNNLVWKNGIADTDYEDDEEENEEDNIKTNYNTNTIKSTVINATDSDTTLIGTDDDINLDEDIVTKETSGIVLPITPPLTPIGSSPNLIQSVFSVLGAAAAAGVNNVGSVVNSVVVGSGARGTSGEGLERVVGTERKSVSVSDVLGMGMGGSSGLTGSQGQGQVDASGAVG